MFVSDLRDMIERNADPAMLPFLILLDYYAVSIGWLFDDQPLEQWQFGFLVLELGPIFLLAALGAWGLSFVPFLVSRGMKKSLRSAAKFLPLVALIAFLFGLGVAVFDPGFVEGFKREYAL